MAWSGCWWLGGLEVKGFPIYPQEPGARSNPNPNHLRATWRFLDQMEVVVWRFRPGKKLGGSAKPQLKAVGVGAYLRF